MKTHMFIDKEMLARPHTVRTSVQELTRWREIRFSKDLPTGALDNALGLLKEYNDVLDSLYLHELEQEPANVDAVDTKSQCA